MDKRRAPVAGFVAGGGFFDFKDAGPEVAEVHGAEGAGDGAGEVDYEDAGEGEGLRGHSNIDAIAWGRKNLTMSLLYGMVYTKSALRTKAKVFMSGRSQPSVPGDFLAERDMSLPQVREELCAAGI